jgi:hypothetical protein
VTFAVNCGSRESAVARMMAGFVPSTMRAFRD